MLKAVSSITNAIGALNYKGTWNASTNTPALASGVGTKGDYYVVSVAGTTSLDGISNWGIGDWAVFNGSVWQRVEGGADLNGVNLSVTGTTTLSGLTASTALALDASKNVVSVTNTGTGNNVLATSPSITSPTFATDTTHSYLTASAAVATDANKKLVSVTNTGTGNNVLATSPTFSGTPRLGTQTVPTTITGGQVQLINDCLIFSGVTSIGSPYTQNLQIDITFAGDLSSNRAIALVEVAIASRQWANTPGVAFGWLFANTTSITPDIFTVFNTTGVTVSQGTLTATSGGASVLRITFDATNVHDRIGYTIRIPTMSGGTGPSVSSIVATLV